MVSRREMGRAREAACVCEFKRTKLRMEGKGEVRGTWGRAFVERRTNGQEVETGQDGEREETAEEERLKRPHQEGVSKGNQRGGDSCRKVCVSEKLRQRSRREREKRWGGAESMRHREWQGGERDWSQRERQGRETQAPSESGLRESPSSEPPFPQLLPEVGEGVGERQEGGTWRGVGGGRLTIQLYHQRKNEHFLPCLSLLVSFVPPRPDSGCYDPYILPQ